MPEIKLKTNGYLISAFDEIELKFRFDAMSSSVNLKFNDKLSEDQLKVKNLLVKDEYAQILIDDEVVFSGYVAAITPDMAKNKPVLPIKLLSPVAHYIGSAVGKGKTYNNQTVSAIVADLCPDIPVEAAADRILPKFVTYGFENVDEAIRRLCRKTGLLIYSGAWGELVVAERAEPGDIAGTIATGVNVIKLGPVEYNTDAIIIAGQKPLADNINLKEAICTRLKSEGQRQKYYYGDDLSVGSLTAIKSWQKRCPVVIPNWYDDNGSLLNINRWYRVSDNWHDLKDVMLLSSLVFRLSDKGGYTAALMVEC